MFDWIRIVQLEALGAARWLLDQAEFMVEDFWEAVR
jgi:hypothetical protein